MPKRKKRKCRCKKERNKKEVQRYYEIKKNEKCQQEINKRIDAKKKERKR